MTSPIQFNFPLEKNKSAVKKPQPSCSVKIKFHWLIEPSFYVTRKKLLLTPLVPHDPIIDLLRSRAQVFYAIQLVDEGMRGATRVL